MDQDPWSSAASSAWVKADDLSWMQSEYRVRERAMAARLAAREEAVRKAENDLRILQAILGRPSRKK